MAVIANLDPAIEWLLGADESLIRYRTLVDLLDAPPGDKRVSSVVQRQVPEGPTVRALLSGQEADCRFGRDSYSKWTGGHWRLVSHPRGAARPQGGRQADDRRRSRNWKRTMIVAPP